MINVLFAILFFLLSIVIHELTHYSIADHYGYNPRFILKRKGNKWYHFLLSNPAVRFTSDGNIKKRTIICLSPIPICFLINMIIGYFLILPAFGKINNSFILNYILISGLFLTICMSLTDIIHAVKINIKKRVI